MGSDETAARYAKRVSVQLEPPRTSPFSVLKHRQYRLLFGGTVLGMLAFGMLNVVQGVVAFNLTHQNAAVGFVGLGQGLAMVFLSPVGGALSDRVSKRRLLLISQAAIGLMFGLISLLIFTDAITIWLLFGCTLVLGINYAMMGPARQAWIGDMLTGEQLAHGVALQQLMVNATRIVGPLVAGLLISISFIGSGGVYLTMTVTFAFVVAALSLTDPTKPNPNAGKTSVLGDLLEGLSYIWKTREVRLLTIVFAGVVLSAFSYQTLMPGYLVNEVGHKSSDLAKVFGCAAVGGVVTTLIISTRQLRRPEVTMLGFGFAVSVSLALLALAPSYLAALGAAALVGAASSGFQVLNNVSLMQKTSSQYYGRVMSLTMMAFGLNSMFSFPMGVLADHIGERETLLTIAAVSLGVVSWGLWQRRAAAAPQN